MKRFFLTGTVLYALLSFMSLDAQWARTFGGEKSADAATCIQQTRDGGYIIGGSTESFGTVLLCVLKLNTRGNIEWERTYGSYGFQEASYIQQTSEGGYIVAGWTNSLGAGWYDTWIMKLTAKGDIEWQRMYGGSQLDTPSSIQETHDGGYIVAGLTMSFGAGSADFWVLKLYSNGDIEWQRTYGGSLPDEGKFIQQTFDGGYIVAGETQSFAATKDLWVLKLSSNGDIEWQRSYPYEGSHWEETHSIQQTTDGGYIMAGQTIAANSEDSDFWVLKLSSFGDIEWQRSYGDLNPQKMGSAQQTSDSGYILSGFTTISNTEAKLWVLKLKTNGDIEWQHTYGGGGLNRASYIKQTSSGGYIVSGETSAFGAGGYDMLILNIFPSGDIGPSCGLKGRLNATVMDTDAVSQETTAVPKNTNIVPKNTDASPQVTHTVANLICKAPKPKAPKRLRVTALSKNEIRVKWKDKSRYEVGFTIYRKESKKGKWSKIAETKANVKTYEDKGLKANTLYQYRIRAFNIMAKSRYSNIATATTKNE